ncbi:MAG: DUF6653 family protein [Sumerlaeia bacterium]
MKHPRMLHVIADFFQMTDDVWAKHANPWSVYTRYPCLPILAFFIWSRVWIGWWCMVPILLTCLWIWANPRVFGKPKSTKNWPSKAVFGERVLLMHPKIPTPKHHRRAIEFTKFLMLLGTLILIFGLVQQSASNTVLGVTIVLLAKTWFLDRMVWLYHDALRTAPAVRARYYLFDCQKY